MTISLRIKHKNAEISDHHIPVATQGDFQDYWLPVCFELELRLVPLFETGYPVLKLTLDTIPEIIDELSQMKAKMTNRPNFPDWLPQRLERIISELRYVQENFEQIAEASI